MSKRTLFIIIGLLLVLDVAVFLVYLIGHSNSDSTNPLDYMFRDSVSVEMADTIPDALVTDVYDTISRSANFVSRDMIKVGGLSKPMTCSIKVKLLWPKNVNNSTKLGDLHNELLNLMSAPRGESINNALEALFNKPEFASPSNDFVAISGDAQEKGGVHTIQQYRVFPYICTNYLLEMIVVVEKHDGKSLHRNMNVVHYDRQDHRVIPIEKIFNLEKTDSILALVNQNIESLKLRGGHDNWYETIVLPTQFLLGKKSVIFYLHDGAMAPVGAGIHEITVPNDDLSTFFTSYYKEMLNNNTHFTTYDFIMF